MSSELLTSTDHGELHSAVDHGPRNEANLEKHSVEEKAGDAPVAEPANNTDEIKGIKLALIVFGLCFSNIITGLVSTTIPGKKVVFFLLRP
jgi:hypothetical protein